MYFMGVQFHWTLLLLPLAVAAQLLFLHGLAVGLAALNVHFRDIQHLLGNFLTLLFFLCPVLYPVETVPERFKFTMDFNPFALFITAYHKLILDGSLPQGEACLGIVLSIVAAAIFGQLVYNRYHESFAELL